MNTSNTVQLIGFYGGDKTHCLSAWASTFEELDIEIPESIGERIDAIFTYLRPKKRMMPDQLLAYLASAEHGTPFEKSLLHFIVDCDKATHIHLLKHRIGVSINAESARYKELSDRCYIPEDWPEHLQEKLLTHYKESALLYHLVATELTPELGRKRAKESARFFLPHNSKIAADISFNFRSFVHFQGLRNNVVYDGGNAQKEISDIAQDMLCLVKELPGNPFQHSLKACGL